MAKRKVVRTKVKKKKWFTLIAPDIFKNATIGQTHVSEDEQVLGKTATVNLMSITNDMKKQNINVKFVVDSIKDGKGVTRLIGYTLVPASVKRMVRRRSTRIDLSLVCTTADNVKLRIKPMILTRFAVKGAGKTIIRKNAQDYIVKNIKKAKYDDLVQMILVNKFQRAMKDELKKYAAIKICEIRSFKVEESDQAKESQETVEKA